MAPQSSVLAAVLLLCMMAFAVGQNKVVVFEEPSDRDVYRVKGTDFPAPDGDASGLDSTGTFKGAHVAPNGKVLIRKMSSEMGGYVEVYELCDGPAGNDPLGYSCKSQTFAADLVTFCTVGGADLMLTIQHGGGPEDRSADNKPTDKLQVYSFNEDPNVWAMVRTVNSGFLPKYNGPEETATGLWGNAYGFFFERVVQLSCKNDRIMMSNEIGQVKFVDLIENQV